MKRKSYLARVALLAGVYLVGATSVFADDAADVIAAAKAQWAAGIQGLSAAKQMETVADDYTEFNPVYPTRLDGKALNTALAEASLKDGSKTITAEMTNEKVQIYGNTAILTYNYIGVAHNEDGENEPVAAKSTRVYVKQNGNWMLVHANFAPVMMPD
jgi:ketosteroid isomerase-like protein